MELQVRTSAFCGCLFGALLSGQSEQERLCPMAILPPHDVCHLTFWWLFVRDLTQWAGRARETVSEGSLCHFTMVVIEGPAITAQLTTSFMLGLSRGFL